MSREQKLALILGFLAVLVVAMLISDHYSKANNDRLAAEVADSPQAIDPATPSPYSGPLASDAGRGNTAFAPLPPTGVDASASVAGSGFLDDALRNADANRTSGDIPGAVPEPIVLTQGGVNEGSSISSDDSLLDELRRRGENLTNGIREIPAAASTTSVPIDPNRESPADPSSPREPADGQMGERTPSGDAPAPTAPRAEERWHTVAANESLFAISKKYYGEGKHWQKLADANKSRLSGKSDLRVGVRLLIPDAATLGIGSSIPSRAKPEAKPQAKPDTKPTAKPPVKPTTPKAPASTGGRTYEVKKGDTLGAIAMRELGTTKRAGEILTLNKLTNANQIRVGQKLMLPAK